MFEQIFNLNGITEFSPIVVFLLFFFATFVSEDAACVTAGALAGRGEIGFTFALTACLAGIFVGDILLYWTGRIAGERISRTRIFSLFISRTAFERASIWLDKQGAWAIFSSRFVAGLRLPTYLAAGFLRTSFPKFAFYFFAASVIWTPLIIGSIAYSQKFLLVPNLFLTIIFGIVAVKIFLHFTSWKNRRLLVGRIKRLTNWEFWALPVFYFPVVIYISILAVRFRSLSIFADANPAIEAGGFIGESKREIYEGLQKSEAAAPHLLNYVFLSAKLEKTEQMRIAESFMHEKSLKFPIALKPNVGERGTGVFLVKTREELKHRIETAQTDLIVQEFAEGLEFSVFYYRYPKNRHGRIFSITEKRFPSVVGDGKASLETLILREKRAVALAGAYFERNAEKLRIVPAVGEEVSIIDIGTHSKGAIFLDGEWVKTSKLEKEIDGICRGYEGFHFGRFDLRTASKEDFRRGKFKIIELNGVTSEATNIYDPKNSLREAYCFLFRQWRIAFEIGSQNRETGAVASPTTVRQLIKLIYENRFEKSAGKSKMKTRKSEIKQCV